MPDTCVPAGGAQLPYVLDPATEFTHVPPDRLIFDTPNGSFTVADKSGLIGAVLTCCQNGGDIEQAFDRIEDSEHRALARDHVITLLLQRGVLRAGAGGFPARERDVFCDWLRFIGVGRELPCRIMIAGEGGICDAIHDELCALGLDGDRFAGELSADDGVLVFGQDRPDEAGLRNFNRLAIEAGLPLLPVSVHRHVITLGPFIIPGATACAECVYHRRQANGGFEPEGPLPGTEVARHASGFVLRLAAMMAVEEIVRFGFGAAYDLHTASLLRHSVLTGKRTQSVVLKLPRCPVCGAGNGRAPLCDGLSLADSAGTEVLE